MEKINIFVIDVQGFKPKSHFIIKELAIVSYTLDKGMIIKHFLFKRPYPLQTLSGKEQYGVKWLERHYHGLNWNDGYVDIAQLPQLLAADIKDTDVVYVKGSEKISILSNYLRCTILDLEDVLCPSLKFLNEFAPVQGACVYDHNHNCALRNALLLRQWCKDTGI